MVNVDAGSYCYNTAVRGAQNEPALAKSSLFSLAKGLTHWTTAPGFLRVLMNIAEGLHCARADDWGNVHFVQPIATCKVKYGVHDGVDICSEYESNDESE